MPGGLCRPPGIGQLVVQAPSDTGVSAHGHVGAGEITFFQGASESGVDVDKQFVEVGIRSRDLRLVLSVGLGQIQVTR